MEQVLRLLTSLALSATLLAAAPSDPSGSSDGLAAGAFGAASQHWAHSIEGGKAVAVKGRRTIVSRASELMDDVVENADRVQVATARPYIPSESNLRALLARSCDDGVLCEGRQGNGLNPLFVGPPENAAPAERIDGEPRPVVTVEDVARFLPTTVVLHAEPEGWAVIGVPANFWTYVRPITVEGQLLGEEAAVRFTPQLYEWHYGDGESKVTRSGGSSWVGSGQEELTATSTSHVYANKRSAQASVTVYWSAEYRFAGGDWIPVEGAVSNSSPEQRMLVVKERTVLTAR